MTAQDANAAPRALLLISGDEQPDTGGHSAFPNPHSALPADGGPAAVEPAGWEVLLRRAAETPRCVALLPVAALDGAGEVRLATLRRDAPDATPVLVAAPDELERALGLARQQAVGAIVPPGSWRQPAEWALWLEWLTRPAAADLLAGYLGPEATIQSWTVRGTDDGQAAHERVGQWTETAGLELRQRHDLRLVFEELMNNAALHAFGDSRPLLPRQRLRLGTLGPGERIEVRLGEAGNRAGLVVTDTGGRLSADRVLEGLARQVGEAGVRDTAGRGLFLAWRLALRLLIRIEPGRRTEVGALFLKDHHLADPLLDQGPPSPMLVLETRGSGSGRSAPPGRDGE